LTPPDIFLDLLTAGLSREALAAPVTESGIAAVSDRIFGPPPGRLAIDKLGNDTICDVYRRFIDSDRFRAACGRICASYAW